MGLTCSLLGHAFEDTDVERDREEQGSEVVTIVREVERCRRCGETRTISENKEVTTIVDPDDVESAGDESAGSRPAAETVEDSSTAEVGGGFAGGTETDPSFDPPDDPEEEDAEILEDDGETPREPGQWPDDEADFEPNTLTGNPTDVDAAGDADTGGEAVAEPTEEMATGGDADDTADEADMADAAPSPEPAATSVPAGDYVCPECGFTTSAAESSLREGDSCPKCRRGYLAAQ